MRIFHITKSISALSSKKKAGGDSRTEKRELTRDKGKGAAPVIVHDFRLSLEAKKKEKKRRRWKYNNIDMTGHNNTWHIKRKIIEIFQLRTSGEMVVPVEILSAPVQI